MYFSFSRIFIVFLVFTFASSAFAGNTQTRKEPRILRNMGDLNCLQIQYFSQLQSGNIATTHTCTYAANTDGVLGDTWWITRSSNNGMQIKARKDNWCLAINENEDSQAGMPVTWKTCRRSSDAQTWSFQVPPNENHPARRIRNVLTGRCLTAFNGRLTGARCQRKSSLKQLWDASPVRVAAARLGRGAVEASLDHPSFPGISQAIVRRIPGTNQVTGFGDIALGELQGDRIIVPKPPRKSYSPYRADPACPLVSRNGVGQNCQAQSTNRDTRLWRGGIIPYSFACPGGLQDLSLDFINNPRTPDTPRDSEEVVRAAISFLSENTVLEFREVSGAIAGSDLANREPREILYFCFDELGGEAAGTSAVGFTGQRNQIVKFRQPDSLIDPGTMSLSVTERTAYHEIFHAIGFIHEHQRPDRDQYIRINFDNLIDTAQARRSFSIVPEARSITPYDVSSITHYVPGSALFIDLNEDTITRRPGASGRIGGLRPSPQDIDAVNLLYADEAERAIPDLRGHRTMTLTIERLTSGDTDGNRGRKVAIDFYAKVGIGAGRNWPDFSTSGVNRYTSNVIEEDDNDVRPMWTFDTLVPPRRDAKIVIQINDEDT